MELFKVLLFPLCFASLTACSSMNKKTDSVENKKEEKLPMITKPYVRKIWIPEEIRNNGAEYVEGHYLYQIERNSTWSK